MSRRIPAELAAEVRRQLQHPMLEQTLRAHMGELPAFLPPRPIDTELHSSCQMLNHSLHHHQDAALAISQHYSIALHQFHAAAQIIERHPVARDRIRFLDFACGYGRLLNLLVHGLPPAQVFGAEILPQAVSWVSERLGIEVFESTARPEAFEPPGRFDLIWVASLFSHLPEELFIRWLTRLESLLTPHGVLCFTVHDKALLPDDVPMPDSGFLYIESSENSELDAEIYGTTYVTESFVNQAIARALGSDRPYRRFPRLIAYEQDFYMISGPDGRALANMDGLRRGVRGWLDGCRIDAENNLHLHGWAASMDGDRLEHVEVNINGEIRKIATDEPRPEVARVLGRPELNQCGWSCRIELPAQPVASYLTISARTPSDPPSLIYTGPISRSSE